MGFLKEILISVIRFVLLGGVAVGGVFAGMAIRKSKDAKAALLADAKEEK